MSIENIVNRIKQVHPDYVALIKIGVFYHAYAKDAYIVSYLFGYKRKAFGDNGTTVGFPKSSLAYVESVLEKRHINYIVIDRAHQYEVDEKVDFKGSNKYIEVYNKAHKNIRLQERVQNIYNYLIENMEDEDIKNKIKKIEDMLYNEEGKVCGD